MTDAEMQARIDKAIELLRPEAQELVPLLLNDHTTQHGYGRLLGVASSLPKWYGRLFVLACVKEGYPSDTAQIVLNKLPS